MWAVCTKKDDLWVKWIHHVYLKGEDIWEHQALPSSSWHWKKLMCIKNDFKEHKQKVCGHYSIAEGYKLLQHISEKVHWDRVVWGRFNSPKSSFIYWLTTLNRLKTKDRIKGYVSLQNTNCLLCEEKEEIAQHLFFDCRFSRRCLEAILKWLDWSLKITDMHRITKWICKVRLNSFQKRVYSAVVAALIYWIWHGRNRKVWCMENTTVENVTNLVQKTVKNRLLAIGCKKKEMRYWDWVINL